MWRHLFALSLLLGSILLPAVSRAAGPPPLIAVQPLDNIVLKGGTATFIVVATSGTTMTYQWYFAGGAINGATAATLTRNNVTASMAGSYYVIVRNASGPVTSRTASLTILNSAPTASNDTYNTPEDTLLTVSAPGVLANDSDLDGDTLSALLVTNVAHGTLSLATNGAFYYLPATNYNGSDSFSYRVTDSYATSAVATVTLTVTPVNDPPTAVDDNTFTFKNVSLTIPVLANDFDVDGNSLSITGASSTNGTVVISGTNIVYTPALNFVGTSLFSYTISDGSLSDTGLVMVSVMDTSFQLNQAWTTNYAGSANAGDYLQATVLDGQGNVYVTGYAKESASGNYDYVTLKYNSSGNRLWRAVYDGLGGDDQAKALAVDAAGNVYVTGSSKSNGWDYATVKYDSNGNQLWVARYNGTANKDDQACAVAVDAYGNVVVTGASKGSGDHYNYVTIKYDTTGNQLWLARYIGPGNAEDDAKAVALDQAGNVYVTGQSKGSGTDFDYATVKYSSAGTQLWAARYDGPSGSADHATALALDSGGNVFVTGDSIDKSSDYATIKYDASGNQLWVSRYDGPAGKNDFAVALALDKSGDVFVTGASEAGGGKSDYATIKYSPTGTQLWAQRYDFGDDDEATAIALDPSDDVYVTGASKASATGYDIATVKYLGTDGTQKAVARYNSSGNVNDTGISLAVDTNYNVYVGGQGFNPLDFVLVKYTPTYWLPTVVTLPASAVGATSATLNATINPRGASTTCYFQYGVTTNYDSVTSSGVFPPGTNSLPVSVQLTGFQPGTVYHYRVVATNNAGLVVSADGSFTTSYLPPTATTLGASNINSASAVLNADVNPQGTSTVYCFQYGFTTNYGSWSSTNFIVVAGNSPALVKTSGLGLPITGLAPGTVYHYRIVAANSGGFSAGEDATFTTASAQPVQFTGALNPSLGKMQLALTGIPGVAYTVVSAPDLSIPVENWTNLGTMQEVSSGQYQFTDNRPASPSCFYRIRTP